MEPESAPRTGAVVHGARRLLLADAGGLLTLSLLAVGLGLGGNALRREPVPWRYTSAQARLQTAVASLSAGGLAGRPVEQISLETFKQMATNRTALILDARPDFFYHAGHVPGAYNMSRESFAGDYARLRPRIDQAKNATIVVYCSDADCPDSGLVASALKQLGFQQVVDFAAGWEGWTAADLPEEKQTPR